MRLIGVLGDAGFNVGATLKPDGHTCKTYQASHAIRGCQMVIFARVACIQKALRTLKHVPE